MVDLFGVMETKTNCEKITEIRQSMDLESDIITNADRTSDDNCDSICIEWPKSIWSFHLISLNRQFINAEMKNVGVYVLWSALKQMKITTVITYLAFADDVIFFVRDSHKSATTLKEIHDEFSHFSGREIINCGKSFIIFSKKYTKREPWILKS